MPKNLQLKIKKRERHWFQKYSEYVITKLNNGVTIITHSRVMSYWGRKTRVNETIDGQCVIEVCVGCWGAHRELSGINQVGKVGGNGKEHIIERCLYYTMSKWRKLLRWKLGKNAWETVEERYKGAEKSFKPGSQAVWCRYQVENKDNERADVGLCGEGCSTSII